EAGYELETDTMNLRTGISWVNNIADSGGLSDYLAESGFDTVQDHINGIGLHIMAGFGPVTFIGEYVQALDAFAEAGDMEADPSGMNTGTAFSAEPAAWNTEVAYSTEILGKESIFAIGYQGTSEAVDLGLPETRILAVASMVLLPGTALSMEYSYDTDYDVADGGTGENASVIITQLAYEF
ncbi:MAG: LbtU family siderophore porin, partial [Desulfocapsa sp.]|nr:LbtU family siderophore porin [Desulfocapsa sp.]